MKNMLTIFLLMIFTACGSGGGGSTNDQDNNNQDNNDQEITYSIEGVISGFTRSPDTNEIGRATLQNNGSDDLELYGDRGFVFSIKLKNNESYNVTILSDPPWQTCIVENGSGTIFGSDITNIRVNCENEVEPPPLSYSIGGTISGFIPDDLDLVLSRQTPRLWEEIKITQNGDFTFKNLLEDNSMYIVSVQKDNSLFYYPYPQLCEVENKQGIISGANVTDIKVICNNYDIKAISIDQNGNVGNGNSTNPSISENGRFIVFKSKAMLVSGLNQFQRQSNIFVYDSESNSVRLINRNQYGKEANEGADKPSINNSGQFIVFSSHSSDLVADDLNDITDIFIYNYQNGRTSLVSVASDGTQANRWSIRPFISDSGRFVIFESSASNLVPNDTNENIDTFIHDTQTGETKLYTGDEGAIFSSDVDSSDGRYNVFHDNIDGLQGVYVQDIQSGELEYLSQPTDFDINHYSGGIWPKISKDGKFIVFYSRTPFIPTDKNGINDIYLVPNPLFK